LGADLEKKFLGSKINFKKKKNNNNNCKTILLAVRRQSVKIRGKTILLGMPPVCKKGFRIY